jgi:hypothetical protein
VCLAQGFSPGFKKRQKGNREQGTGAEGKRVKREEGKRGTGNSMIGCGASLCAWPRALARGTK